MTKHSEVLELNGKRYDAETGKLLGSARSHDKPQKIKVSYTKSVHDLKNVNRIHNRKSRAKTLMRGAVKKPKSPSKIPVHHINHTAHPSHSHKLEADPKRVDRAKQVVKHQSVSRFGNLQTKSTFVENRKPVVADVPVRPEPAPSPESQPPVDPHSYVRTIFEQAMDRANSHRQVAHPQPTRRQHVSHRFGVSSGVLSLSTAAIVAILLIGVVVYQNVPSIGMRLAAQRAGVPARIPEYQPSGFGLDGPIEYRPGQVTLNYQSNSDNRQFQIHQRASTWQNNDLQQNVLGAVSTDYQTLSEDDKTVYIYDNGATWVSEGIWYEVEGNPSLSNDQLLRLASSL